MHDVAFRDNALDEAFFRHRECPDASSMIGLCHGLNQVSRGARRVYLPVQMAVAALLEDCQGRIEHWIVRMRALGTLAKRISKYHGGQSPRTSGTHGYEGFRACRDEAEKECVACLSECHLRHLKWVSTLSLAVKFLRSDK